MIEPQPKIPTAPRHIIGGVVSAALMLGAIAGGFWLAGMLPPDEFDVPTEATLKLARYLALVLGFVAAVGIALVWSNVKRQSEQDWLDQLRRIGGGKKREDAP